MTAQLRQMLQTPLANLFRVFRRVSTLNQSCLQCREEVYSCWSTASGARVNNYGARIDLILLAEPLAEPHSTSVGTTTPEDSSTTPGDVASIPGDLTAVPRDSTAAQSNYGNAATPAFKVLSPSQCMWVPILLPYCPM